MGAGVQVLACSSGSKIRTTDAPRRPGPGRSRGPRATPRTGPRSGSSTSASSGENASAFSTSSSRIRSPAVRFSVVITGAGRRVDRRPAGSRSATSRASSRHVRPIRSGRPRRRPRTAGRGARALRPADTSVSRTSSNCSRDIPPRLQALGEAEDHRDRRPQLVPEPADQLLAARRPLQQRLLRHLQLARPPAPALERLGQLLDHGGRDLGGQQRPARGRPPDRVQDLVAVGVLQDVAGGAGHQHVADRPLLLECR